MILVSDPLLLTIFRVFIALRSMTNRPTETPHEARPGSGRTYRDDFLGRIGTVMESIPATYDRRQRLRECLIKSGAENLPDYELLQVMLFTSNPHADVESLVGRLLERFGSLAEIVGADTEALAAAGLSLPAIAGVKFVREVALRFMRAELHKRPMVGSWDKLVAYCSAQIAYSMVEEFHILFLDRKNSLIRDERQQRGTVDHTPVYTREVIRRALEVGASALILVHNHPSGDPTPSAADIAVTNDIVKAASTLGIAVHDHLIIGRNEHISLRELGIIR
jgi:DNA repair protein RadC